MPQFHISNKLNPTHFIVKAIARAWAQAGAAGIVLIGRTTETLDLTLRNVSNIDASIPTIAEPTDVSKESSVKSLFAQVKTKFGKAHVLVNCATKWTQGPIGDVPVESWWSDYVRCVFIKCVLDIQNQQLTNLAQLGDKC